ncbi:MAG: cell division protein FtsZ [Crocinitomicaceae bacterium]|nr:cell division protein FtsZ [Crocinitomicaceae bacterium]
MKFDLPKEQSSIIKVIGVGGGGSNAVNHMYRQGIKGVDFVVCNTDHQALDTSPVPTKIPLGQSLTEGRGAGSVPDVGKNAAIENLEDINEILAKNTKMIFVTAGMGGGTGTGAAPVIAQAARDMGILTVGIVTVPFTFEGRKRRSQAEEGIEKMREAVDTLLVINNDKLREMFGNLTLVNAFENADDVLAIAAKGIAEVISVTGQINVDFNDVNTVMKDSGVAIMGSAEAEGENRAVKCVESALNSPLLNDNNIDGAKYVLLNITYGSQAVLMDEISDITDYIQEEAGSTADVIWGHGYDESLDDKLCVTIIATGFNTTPHTGLSMKAPKKNKILLEDEPSIENNEDINLNTNSDSDDGTLIEKEPITKTKKFILEDDPPIESNEKDEVLDTPNIKEPINSHQTKMDNDGKVRYLLEDDEISNQEKKHINEIDSNFDNVSEEEKMEEQSFSAEEKSVEPKELSEERIERIRKATEKLRSPLGLNEMESEPAYKRRNIDLKDVKYSDEPSSSKYTLWENINDSGEKESGLSDHNSFLHDNVD